MRITFNVYDTEREDRDSLINLDIFPSMTLETVQESLVSETGIPLAQQSIYYGGRPITDNHRTIEELGISDGDVLALHRRKKPRASGPPANRPPQPAAQPSESDPDPELFRLQLLEDPVARADFTARNPGNASVIDNPVEFARMYRESRDRERREERERQQEILRLNEEYMTPEVQKKIEEMIRQERVMENLQSAMEHNPEVFGRVHMLYLDVEVNGHRVKALVDSGAQATIMSPSCAEACGIMRLIDTRFAGVARGVGTANILGRVHTAPIKIGPLYLPCSFTVMEGKSVDLLLGLDMLKRFQATIDLGKDMLIIQGHEVAFLGEADIPKDEESVPPEPTVAGPSGTGIGAQTGALLGPQAQGQSQAQPQPPVQNPTPIQQHIPTPPPQQVPQPQAQASSSIAPAQPAAAPGTQPPMPASQLTSHLISQLVAMGVTRAEAVQALEAADGDMNRAVSFLFEGN